MTARRRRHVPQRTCIACQQKRSKRELVRVVRLPEGDLQVDPKGKLSGRGAYLCPTPACWEAALVQGRLARALKCAVTLEQVEALREAALPLLVEPVVDESEIPPAKESPD